MVSILLSISFVYLFILLGYIAKAIFKEQIDSKTLTIISVYFMQPFVSIWGFSNAKIENEHFSIVAIYFLIIISLLIPVSLIAKKIFKDAKERSIFTISGFVGNTGNIGIPLAIALFGQKSIVYTTLINLANVFVIYVLGVYIYSRGSFNIKKSIINILKIPIIPISAIMIFLNLQGFEFSIEAKELFKMGAYGGIVLQLLLLGTFLQTIQIKEVNKKLYSWVLALKFAIIPLFTLFILQFFQLSNLAKSILLMQMLTPLAIANINLASLYNCRPKDVTALILISTLAFIVVVALFANISN